MSEMRQDMISKEWVVIAPGRAKRPNQNHRTSDVRPPLPRHRPDCPFCPGNEAQTPDSLLSFPAGGPWQTRVIPNKFAALSHEEECCHGSAAVVVETPHSQIITC